MPRLTGLTLMDMYRTAVVFSVIWAQIAGHCQFPGDWQGSWFQSGLGEVTIHEHAIDRKGMCKEVYREFYLVENRDMGCFQCLLIMQRHRNIIQYKESYCLTLDNLDDICSQIRVEAILYTLVREPALPVACPFQDAFHFRYNNNTGGWCTQPSSYAHSCASRAKFQFQFEHCPEAAYTYYRALEFECLASWKDGSEMFMYGGFTGPGLATKEDTYRCFMYNVFGTVVQLAMSADATCRGLRSPTDGPLIMEFTKDGFGWPQPGCRFPSWFMDSTWQDLSAQHIYIPDEVGETISISYRHNTHAHAHVRYAMRCLRPDLENSTNSVFIGVSFSSHECENRFQCVRFVKRRDNFVEIYKGAFVHSEDDKCHDIHFQHAKMTIAIPRHMPGQPCPILGRYFLLPDSSGCSVDIRSGCNRTSHMQIVSTCSPRPLGDLECLDSWQEHDKKFMLARKTADPSGLTNCFSVRHIDGTIEFRTDQKCNRGSPDLFENALAYTLDENPGMCADIETVLVHPNQNSLSQSNHNFGSGYKHTGDDPPGNDYYDDDPQATFFNSGSHSYFHANSVVLIAVLLTAALCR